VTESTGWYVTHPHNWTHGAKPVAACDAAGCGWVHWKLWPVEPSEPTHVTERVWKPPVPQVTEGAIQLPGAQL
jgi:hypothetical protein